MSRQVTLSCSRGWENLLARKQWKAFYTEGIAMWKGQSSWRGKACSEMVVGWSGERRMMKGARLKKGSCNSTYQRGDCNICSRSWGLKVKRVTEQSIWEIPQKESRNPVETLQCCILSGALLVLCKWCFGLKGSQMSGTIHKSVALQLKPWVRGQHGWLMDAILRKLLGKGQVLGCPRLESNLATRLGVWPNGRKECFWKGNLTETKLEAGHQCYHVALEITARHVRLAREGWGLEYLEVGSRGQEYLSPADLRWLENDNWLPSSCQKVS